MKKRQKNFKNTRGPQKQGKPHHDKNQSQQRHPRNSGKSSSGSNVKANIFGFHAVQAAWINPKRSIHALFATEQAYQSLIEDLPDSMPGRPQPTIMDKDSVGALCQAGAVHQGIAISAAPLAEMSVTDLIIQNRDEQNALLVMLDQVTDPHNVGAILRSACAFGAKGVIMQRRHAPELEGVLAKTACGAADHIPVAYETNLSRALEELQEGGYFSYGLDERGEQEIGQIKPGGKTVIVLGAEGDGMRRLVAEHCDALVRLPMAGPMPSINVSNAAAVALYALKA